VAAKDFWSLTVCDSQTRSMLQTDQQFPGVDSLKESLKQNEDGSFDVNFGPFAPKGWENNWVQTVPNKSWNTIFGLYDPQEPFYGKAWKPGGLQLVQDGEEREHSTVTSGTCRAEMHEKTSNFLVSNELHATQTTEDALHPSRKFLISLGRVGEGRDEFDCF
jgi:hypothetical protein